MPKHRSEKFRTNIEKVSRRVRFARQEASLTQVQLAKQAGVSVTQLSKLEGVKVLEVQVSVYFAICEALDLDPVRVWYGEQGAPKKRTATP